MTAITTIVGLIPLVPSASGIFELRAATASVRAHNFLATLHAIAHDRLP